MTSRTSPTARRLASARLVAALGLAACGGSSDDGADSASTSVDPTLAADTVPESSVAETTAVEPAATEPVSTDLVVAAESETPAAVATDPVETEPASPDTTPAEPAPTETSPSGDDPSCLVGNWLITQDEMNGYYDALEGSLSTGGPALTIDIVGDVLLTFGATDYSYAADFDLAIDVAGQSGTGDTTGTVSGTWDVVDDRVVTTLGSSNLDVVVTVAGVTLSGSDLANGILNSAPINNAPFDCAGPTIGFQLSDPDGPRHDVVLTPA